MAQLHLEQRIEKLHQRRQPIRSTDDRIARHAMQQGELAFDSFRVSQDCRFEAVIALHPDQYFQRRIRLGDLEKMGVQAIRSEEHTSELQTIMRTTYAVCHLN